MVMQQHTQNTLLKQTTYKATVCFNRVNLWNIMAQQPSIVVKYHWLNV